MMKYIRILLKTLLEDGGYGVLTTKDGEECITKLKEEKFDLVLIDFFMPGVSGREVCERIRADSELKDLKVVFLTSAAFSQMGVKELDKMNVLDYIQKPFDNEDFKRRIKKITG